MLIAVGASMLLFASPLSAQPYEELDHEEDSPGSGLGRVISPTMTLTVKAREAFRQALKSFHSTPKDKRLGSSGLLHMRLFVVEESFKRRQKSIPSP